MKKQIKVQMKQPIKKCQQKWTNENNEQMKKM